MDVVNYLSYSKQNVSVRVKFQGNVIFTLFWYSFPLSQLTILICYVYSFLYFRLSSTRSLIKWFLIKQRVVRQKAMLKAPTCRNTHLTSSELANVTKPYLEYCKGQSFKLVKIICHKIIFELPLPAIVLKSCAPELAPVLNKLFQLSYNLGIFPSSWKLAHIFPIPKKVTNLTLQTIALLQSLLSSLRLWRPLSPNNCLLSLKQTIFFLTIIMGLDKPDLPGTF